MPNFIQYWNKRTCVYCLYYVCGEESCLQEVVIQSIRDNVNVPELDYHTHDGVDKIADIMDTLTSEPVGNKKLVIIRNGHRIKKFDRVVAWAEQVAGFKETCLVIQTDEKKVATKEARYRPFVELGMFVECKPLSKAKLFGWLSTFLSIDEAAFDLLLESCGWELRRVLNEARKLKFVGRNLTVRDIVDLCPRTYDERFVELLMVGNKAKAKHALKLVSQDEASRIVGLLDYKLNLILQLALLRRQGISMKEAVTQLSITFFVAKLHWDLCQTMTIAMIRKRLSLLVKVDTLVKAGQNGALAVLYALW